MAPKMVLLAGAPPAEAVNEASCTLQRFDETFCRFLEIPFESQQRVGRDSRPHAAWRSLPLAREPLHTGLSQHHHQEHLSQERHGRPSDFFTTADLSADGPWRSVDDVAALDEFCEQSLAVHNSQLGDDGPGDDGGLAQHSTITTTTNATTDTSFLTDSSRADASTSILSTSAATAPPAPVPANLSDVEDVPPAARILALGPQTITLNLIVGVLSIAQPRDVTTRWGRRLSLVEVLVGDDTKSGFAITFWLDTPPSHASRALDAAVRGLRRQDVVLVRNVGLHAFRGRVYGQSLRHGLTQLSLLWRRDGSGHYSTRALARRSAAGGSAVHPQTQKTRLVKDWVLRFVTPHAPSTRSTRSAKKTWDDPPDDTQQCLTESE